MLPSNIIYPEFVADQLLTAEHLNQLFGYLDDQGRMTRTNLIGVGIVCGLQIITGENGSTITITEGCGVTSEGYLVSFPEITYDKAALYNPLTPKFYTGRFVNNNNKTKKVNTLWELTLTAGTNQETIDLDESFLDDKIVLLFVELLEEENKNCDPNSCDDKGIRITVNLRALLISVNEVGKLDTLLNSTDKDLVNAQRFNALAEMKMPRFNVPNTDPVTTEDIFEAYQSILSEKFIGEVVELLKDAHTTFLNLIRDEYPDNPFDGMSDDFSFLYDGTITKNNLIHIQYYYDLFSDLLQAYDEFRRTGVDMLSTCCPDRELFPRHLLLGEARALPESEQSLHRNYFIYSPLFDKKDIVHKLRSLFRRLVLMKDNFSLPAISDSSLIQSADSFIRITPSLLGNVSLSDRAIPYYYKPKTGSPYLYTYWNSYKTLLGKQDTNLSYNASSYSVKEWVVTPLEYDLEPYNFFRVEGIIGKPFGSVLAVLKERILVNRLPFDVIALRTGEMNLDNVDFSKTACAVSDLEIAYDIARREYEAVIGLSIEWLNKNRSMAISFVNTGNDHRLENFIGKMLQPVKNFLVIDLPGFISDYTGFIKLYEEIEIEASAIRNILVLKSNIRNNENADFLEDLIDHFDEIIMAAKKGPFRALYQAFMQRFNDIYGGQFFSYYTEKNPGIQHKAGVPTGGTFIIVYHENDLVPLPGPVRGDAPANTNMSSAIAKALVKENPQRIVAGKTNDISFVIDEIAALKKKGAANNLLEARLKELMNAPALPVALPVSPASGLAAPPDIVKTIKSGTVIADFYLPYLCCSDCPPIQYIVQPPPPNEPPVAVPVSNVDAITIGDGVILELDGSNSFDPEHLAIKAYTWSLGLASPDCTIVAPSSITTQVTDLAEGDYEFKLIVTDQEGAVSAPVSLFVTVSLPVNQIPVAIPASNVASFVLGDETVLELNGTGSFDPEGAPIKKYSWKLATGSPACIIDSPATETTTVSGIAAPGTYSFILVVTDQQDAASGASSISVTVTQSANEPPVANAGEDQTIFVNTNTVVFIPGTVTLNGSASSDSDGAIQSFAWQQISGPPNRPATIPDPTTDKPFVGNLFPGIYMFKLTVTDDRGVSASDSVTVNVEITPNELPVANAGEDQTITLSRNSNGLIPGSVNLDGSASSDPDGSIQSFNWIQISGVTGTSSIISNPTSDKPIAGNLFPGVYVFQLTVTDNNGSNATDNVTITVKEPLNLSPFANAGLNRIIDTGGNADLDGSASSDPDGTITNFEWKIIEPVQTVNESISITGNATASLIGMLNNNRYRIRLTVKDDRGGIATDDVYLWTRKNSDLLHKCINGEVMTDLFNVLLEADPNVIGLFKEQFKSFGEVDKLRNVLFGNQVFFQPVAEQIKFFNDYRSLDSETGALQTLPKAMIDWLRELINIIITDSGEFKETRNIALRFYRTVIELAIYISCIQVKDFNAALVKMNVILTAKNIKIFTKEMFAGSFTDADIAEYKLIRQLFADELSRLLRDDTTGAKPLYVDFIIDCTIYFEELDNSTN